VEPVVARVVKWGLGSLAHVTELTFDADMCLLLRVEMPRHR
jgi:hypothetical protein